MTKKLWLVERVFGKSKDHIKISCEGVIKQVENPIHKEIEPGQYVVLEGDIVMEALSERAAEKLIHT